MGFFYVLLHSNNIITLLLLKQRMRGDWFLLQCAEKRAGEGEEVEAGEGAKSAKGAESMDTS